MVPEVKVSRSYYMLWNIYHKDVVISNTLWIDEPVKIQ